MTLLTLGNFRENKWYIQQKLKWHSKELQTPGENYNQLFGIGEIRENLWETLIEFSYENGAAFLSAKSKNSHSVPLKLIHSYSEKGIKAQFPFFSKRKRLKYFKSKLKLILLS